MKPKSEFVFNKNFYIDSSNSIKNANPNSQKAENPRRKTFIGKRLTGPLTGLLSLRVGKYRIIYQLSENKIIIRTVGHRKTIYKR